MTLTLNFRLHSLYAMYPSIGIIVAMPSEAGALFGRNVARRLKQKSFEAIPQANNIQTIVTCAGVGLENAKATAFRLATHGVSALASIGLAGGLDPDLKSGHITVASEVQLIGTANPNNRWQVHLGGATMANTILEEAGMAVKRGLILTAQEAVLTSQAKHSLFVQTRALAVDMESAAVARVAHQSGIPFFGLRAICDTAGKNVPHELFNCLESNGNIRIAALLGSLSHRPSLIPEMLRMGRAYSRARKSLKRGWQTLVEQKALELLIDSQ
jgi:adenosylhomocysteine nucleosidase